MAALGIRLRGSVFLKLLVVLGLVLLLQIPVHRIESLIGEREENRASAESEVRDSWGGVQCIETPLLLVPYEESSPWIRPEGQSTSFMTLAAEDLDVLVSLESFVRRRGIFDVLLYDAEVTISGSFSPPAGVPHSVHARRLVWDGAVVALPSVPDRELPRTIEVGGSPQDLHPGPIEGYVSAPVSLAESPDASLPFTLSMRLMGSGALLFRTVPGATSVEVESDWPHPKFVGALASSHDIDAAGFTAQWRLRGGGGSTFSPWEERDTMTHPSGRTFGVELIQPVDSYRMARRSIKYEFLFTSLTLGIFLIIEVFGDRRIHPIQYLLVGGALVLFYLLVLSLAEHVGFSAAYGVSSAAVVAVVASYAVSALDSRRRGTAVGGLLLTLYAFLYVLLALQEFSLLVGSFGLFSILAVIMFVSRHVNWYALGRQG